MPIQQTMSVDEAKTKFGKKCSAKRDGSRYGKRHSPGQMNKTESAFSDLLESRKQKGEIVEWLFEAITLKLADDTRYTADFLIVHLDGTMELVNVKADYASDPNSLTKIKCAADKFWMYLFSIEKKLSKANGGGWERREF
jgi:hypothetical protein